MFRRGSASLSIAVVVFLMSIGWAHLAWGQVCGDGEWDPGEFCGQDAYVVTGVPDMNHDCVVDLLDFWYFARHYPPNSFGTTADLYIDGVVDLFDYNIFGEGWGDVARPCTSYRPPTLRQGTIALSFSTNASTIVSTATRSIGIDTVHVVVDGWTNADILEWAIESSANIVIASAAAVQSVSSPSPMTCTAGQAYWSGWTYVDGTWPAGPVLFASVPYILMDTNPAWIKFVPLHVPTCFDSPGPRWARSATSQYFAFTDYSNVAINGGTPPVTTGVGGDTPPGFGIVSVAPNPFNPLTTLHFTLPAAMPVTAGVWSVHGKRVRSLSDERVFGVGENTLQWDGRDDQGVPAASGVYFFRLETRVGVDVRRGVLLK
jgi:hypothetical protein